MNIWIDVQKGKHYLLLFSKWASFEIPLLTHLFADRCVTFVTMNKVKQNKKKEVLKVAKIQQQYHRDSAEVILIKI